MTFIFQPQDFDSFETKTTSLIVFIIILSVVEKNINLHYAKR